MANRMVRQPGRKHQHMKMRHGNGGENSYENGSNGNNNGGESGKHGIMKANNNGSQPERKRRENENNIIYVEKKTINEKQRKCGVA
jgi:hypothetical protein